MHGEKINLAAKWKVEVLSADPRLFWNLSGVVTVI